MLRYLEIKQELLREISGKEPLEKLPSRLELCRRLDTTRTTLDKAIKELESEGIVFCRDGSGTYVAIPKGYDIQKPDNWGVIVPDSTQDIYAGLVRGVEEITEQNNINLILCNSDHNLEKQEQYIRRLMLTGVSGLIVAPVVQPQSANRRGGSESLLQTQKPIVLCNAGVDGVNVPVVTSNNFYGGYIAAKHLISCGYRRIAYLSHFLYQASLERCQGYVAALEEAGLPVDRDLIVLDADEYGDCEGYSAAMQLLSRGVDAVFCFNDTLADGVYRAVKESGKQVALDVGVIGYDNSTRALQLQPLLTSVSYRNMDIGRMAAELLLQQIQGVRCDSFPYYLFQPELVERDSCRKTEETV